MTLTISTALADARLVGTKTFLDTGAGTATLALYATTRPANGAAAGGAALVTIPLDKPCGTVAAGALTVTAAIEPLIDASGVALWGRVLNGDGAHAFDGDVSDPAGSGDIKVPSTTLYAGGTTRLVSGVLR